LRRLVTVFAAASVLLGSNAWCALNVVLVRHAEIAAGSDPPLSPQGQARAELLASILRDANVEAIYVTEYRRTQQTAQPAAARFHITPQKLSDNVAIVKAIREHASGTLLVVGHSNTVPEIISRLGGPVVSIGETEFDNLFVLTISGGQTSLLRLRYGSSAASMPASGMLNQRSPVVQITFVRSGGFAFPARRSVQGTIDLQDDHAEVSSEAAYHRVLAPDEAQQLRAGADPGELSKAAGQIAARTRGAADLDHYQITVKTKDGKTQDVSLNTSGASNELQGVSPAVAKLLRWLQEEAQRIQEHRNTAK
jgi:phosphohistidine phosphatase SixA